MKKTHTRQTQSYRRKGGKLWAVLLVSLLVIVAVLVSTGMRLAYYSSPAAPRQSGQYVNIIPHAHRLGIETGVLESVEVSRDDDNFKIRFPRVEDSINQQPNYRVERVPRGESFKWEGGDLRLRHQGIAYAPFPQDVHNTRWRVQLPGRFYQPDGYRVAQDQLSQLISQQLSYGGAFPVFRFVFEYTKNTDVNFIDFACFDARTGFHLGDASSWGADGIKHIYVDADLERWHGGPVEVVADFAFGPVETIDIAPEVGSVIQRDYWSLSLVAATSGAWGSPKPLAFQAGGPMPVKFHERENSGSDKATFVFVSSPPVTHLPLEYKVYNHEGEEVDSITSRSYVFNLQTVSAEAAVDQIAMIRALINPNVRRLVFDVPELYGLPEENYGVDNLFDLSLPNIRIRNQNHFEQVLEGLLQMQFKGEARALQDVKFLSLPREYTNTTPVELLQDFRQYTTHRKAPQYRFHVNPQTHTVEARYSFWEKIKSNLQEILGM